MIFFYHLKYTEKKNKPILRVIQRVSKPGLRIYVNSHQIPKVLGNQGIAILSTSKGILTNFQAIKLGVGGEVLCYVW